MSAAKTDSAYYHLREKLHDGEQRPSRKYSTRRLVRIFYVSSIGLAAYAGASFGVFDLQSSINIENGIGVTAMMTSAIVSCFSTLLLLPFVLDFHGPKIAIILAQISGGLYALANFYPSWYTLMPCGVLTGLTEAFVWSGSASITTFVGEQTAEKNNDADRTAKITHFVGMLFAFMSVGQLIGSGLSFTLLRSLKEDFSILVVSDNKTSDASKSPNISSPDWSLCFANECQEDYIYNITEETLDSYRPVQWCIYLLMGIFAAVQMGSALVSFFFLPRIPAKYGKSLGDKRPPVCSILVFQIKKTFLHIFSLQYLLIFPTYLYVGLNMVYYSAEYNRAYISCTIGVESIGLFTAINGISCLVSTALASYCAPKTGRIPAYLTAVSFDIIYYMIGLLWSPNPSNIYILYILSVTNGVSYGLWWIDITTITTVHFPNRISIGFSTQMLAISLAFFVEYAWSIPLCIYEKIYIILAILCFATVCRLLAEVRLRKRIKKETKATPLEIVG